jgi:thioredoxin 1
MAVTHTTDALLVLEIASHHSVILKYHTDDCGEPCTQLLPIYEELSEEKRYTNIVFLRINADDNPVAKEYILKKKQPIITLYHKGRLLESTTIGTKEEMISLLDVLKKQSSKT